MERRGETGGGKTCSKSCKMKEDDEREARTEQEYEGGVCVC